MFKTIAVFFVMICMWVTYSVIGSTPCNRIDRAAGPVRLLLSGFQSVVNPWADTDQRWMVTRWVISGDLYAQKFIARQFYGDSVYSVCGRQDPDAETGKTIDANSGK